MAYMNQERKALIAASLRKVVPAGWKYTLSVRNFSTLVFTLRQAPVDILGNIRATEGPNLGFSTLALQIDKGYCSINPYYVQNYFSGELRDTFCLIRDALNDGNHDKSDIQTDYFDVGWYIEINVGLWNSPFLDTIPPASQQVAAQKKPLSKASISVESLIDAYALPQDFKQLSPGKKAAATKKAMRTYPELFETT